jgi:23S rRNA maturation mini-RNase III
VGYLGHTVYSLWVTKAILFILSGLLRRYRLFLVGYLGDTVYSLWVTKTILFILCGLLRRYCLFSVGYLDDTHKINSIA